MNVIGLHGLARSGKDTVADFIVKEYGYTKVAFADPLKVGASVVFGLPLERMYGGDRETPVEPWGISIREMLQKFGTECMRNVFRQDFWIVRLEAELIKLAGEGARGVVVPDVRFDNEAEMIRRWNGKVYEITRPGLVRMNHASEAGIDPKHIYASIHNDGTLQELFNKVLNLTQVLEVTD